MTNSLQWWKDALAGKANPATTDGKPARGWYRARYKGQPYVPVAYWYEGDKLECLWDNKPIHVPPKDKEGRVRTPEQIEKERDLRAREAWPFVSMNPIPYEVYEAVVRGEQWPDVDPVAAEQLRGKGDNNPPTDPAELLKEQIEAATAGAKDYAEIKDDETAKKAQTLRSRLTGLSNEVIKTHKAEKEPHLEAGRTVDRKWFPLRDKAQEFADKIRDALKVWETAKYNKAQAEAAKQRAEAAKAEAAGRPAPPPPEPYVPTAVKGAAGRAASVKPKRVVTAITDMDALFKCLRNRPEVEALFLQLAQKIVDANQDVLGVVIETKMDVK